MNDTTSAKEEQAAISRILSSKRNRQLPDNNDAPSSTRPRHSKDTKRQRDHSSLQQDGQADPSHEGSKFLNVNRNPHEHDQKEKQQKARASESHHQPEGQADTSIHQEAVGPRVSRQVNHGARSKQTSTGGPSKRDGPHLQLIAPKRAKPLPIGASNTDATIARLLHSSP